MILNGIRIVQGAELADITVPIGDNFLAGPVNGELFFATGDGTPAEGLYIFDDTNNWKQLDNSVTTSAAVTAALGYTPESTDNKNQPNGYPGLDGSSKINISQIPTLGPSNVTGLAALAGATFTGPIVLSSDPVNPLEAATKQYVDAVATGLTFKDSVRLATVANVPAIAGLLTIDGVPTVIGDRVLLKNQTDETKNGIYIASTASWVRASDFDGTPAGETKSGVYIFVTEGNTNSNSGWVLSTPGTINVGTTALQFTQFTGLAAITAGNGLQKTGSVFDVVGTPGRIVANPSSIDLDVVGIAGTYKSVTTDAYGRVIAGTNPTTLAGYGITDAATASHTHAYLPLSGGNLTGQVLSSARSRWVGVATDFSGAPVELREVNLVANTQTSYVYAPSLGFHWGNINAATIAMHSDGAFHFRGSPYTGTQYRNAYFNDVNIATVGWLSGTGSSQLKAQIGYQRLPGGLILQWGRLSSPSNENSPITVTFPLAFPANCFNVITTVEGINSNGNDAFEAYVVNDSVNVNNFIVRFGAAGTSWPGPNYIRWIAIGY